MTRQRKLITAGVVGLAVVLAAVIYLWTSLDSLIADAIEHYGSQATGTAVGVDSVDISLGQGRATVSGLEVDNPAGFATAYAFALDDISVDLDTKTVWSNPVVIDEIRVQAPRMNYEVNQSGKINLKEIKDHLGSGQKAPGPGENAGKAPPRLIIRHLTIDQGQLDITVAALKDRNWSVDLPSIELKDLGAATNGATPAELGRQVASVLLERGARAEAASRELTGQSLEQFKDQLKDKGREKLQQKGASELKDLLNP